MPWLPQKGSHCSQALEQPGRGSWTEGAIYSDSAPTPTPATCEGGGPTLPAQPRPGGPGPSGWDARITGSTLDMGTQRQFTPGPCPQGTPRLAREQTACDLGAGPVSSPLATPPDWKGHGQTPQLKRQTGTQKKPPEAQRLIDGAMVQREAGGTQNKLWHRLVLVPASSHWASPETRPYSCRPAAAFQPRPRLSSLQPGSVSSLRETLDPQFGSASPRHPWTL